MSSYIDITLPDALLHPRCLVNGVNGPSLTTIQGRAFGELSSEWADLVSWAMARTANSNDYWLGRQPEYLAAMAFVGMVSDGYASAAQKAADVAVYLAGLTISNETYQRYACLSMALAYDMAYQYFSAGERTTVRNKIAAYVASWDAPDSAEKLWGHSHGNICYAAASLPAILQDDPAQNATWLGYMETILDEFWDGVASGTTFWAGFKHFGATDGGTHKGSGPYSYMTQNESFYQWIAPILERALLVDVDDHLDWYWKTLEWQLWHQRPDRIMGHTQGDTRSFCRYHNYTQIHAMQYAQRHTTKMAEYAKWFENEIRSASAFFGGSYSYTNWGPYLMWDIIFKEASKVATEPTTAEMGQQMRVFRNARKLVFRTGWKENDTSLTLAAGRFTGGHQKPAEEAGGFDLCACGEQLLIHAGHYDPAQTVTYREVGSAVNTGHRYTYCKNASAHSVVAIMDSNEPAENKVQSFQQTLHENSFMGKRDGAVDTMANVGGVLWPTNAAINKYQPDDLADFLAESDWNYETFAIEPIETPTHCYAVLNLLPKYYASKVTRYKRHIVWIKPGSIRLSWPYPIIVFWDDLTTHTDATAAEKVQALQFMAQVAPAGVPGDFSISRVISRLGVRILQPGTTQLNSFSGYIDRAGGIYQPTRTDTYDDSKDGTVRIDVYPSSETTQPSFLSVLFPAPASVSESLVPGVTALSKAGKVGVVFGDDNLQLEIDTGDTHASDIVAVSTQAPAAADPRKSIACWPLGLILPIFPSPDGAALTQGDRQQVAGIYRDILAEDWDPPEPGPTPTPPLAPTNLVGTADDGTVALGWSDNEETDIDHYTVYRQEEISSGVWSGWVEISPSSTSSFDDDTVSNGTVYKYRVTATDTESEESEPSNETEEMSPTPGDTPPEDDGAGSIDEADTSPTPIEGSSVDDVGGTAGSGGSIDTADNSPTPKTGGSIGDVT